MLCLRLLFSRRQAIDARLNYKTAICNTDKKFRLAKFRKSPS
jgi:hypothetical protein